MSELYHHGIKGMKWGVRRFQNEDGSLTEAGKIRYRYEQEAGPKKKDLKRAAKSARHVGNVLDRYDMSISATKAISEKAASLGRIVKRKEGGLVDKISREQLGKKRIERLMAKRNKVANMTLKEANTDRRLRKGEIISTAVLGGIGGLPVTAILEVSVRSKRSELAKR